MSKPRVGLGVIIEDEHGNILIGKRKGDHAPYFSIPGGGLEIGETFEAGAIREIEEETTIKLKNPKVIGLTNNLKTFEEEGVHFISVVLHTKEFEGEAQLVESDKCEGWLWVNPRSLPETHFEASIKAVQLFLDEKFYE